MAVYFFQGFLLGIAYVAPIGMQNMYVINTAVSTTRLRSLVTGLITSFFDISLALACFFGVGLFLERIPLLKTLFLGFGCAAVVYIGTGLIRSKPSENRSTEIKESILKTVVKCFTVTWLNPQAIIDGSMLLGGFKASLSGTGSVLFITGVAAASLTWFTSISISVSMFKRFLNNKVLKYINIACGLIIIFFGLRLGYNFVIQIF